MDPTNKSYAFITLLITRFDFLKDFADLSFEVSSAGNPPRVQTGHTEISIGDIYLLGGSVLKRLRTRVR